MNEHGTGSDTIAIVARPQTNEDGWPVDIPREDDVPTNKLALWLDANNVDLNSTDSNGRFRNWIDKSANGSNAGITSSMQQPALARNIINGHNVVRFNADTNIFTVNDSFYSFGTNEENGITIISVACSNEQVTSSLNRQLIYFGSDPKTGWGVSFRKNGGTFYTPTDHNGTELNYSINKAPGDFMISSYRVTFEQVQEVFIDGNLLSSSPINLKFLTSDQINGNKLYIGGRDEILYGDIAELMVWKRALTDSERVVVEQYLAQKWGLQHQTYLPPLEQPETGLLGRWTFDEGEGDLVHDVSGNRKHGTMTNMHPANSWTDGAYGKALEFDGSDDNLTIPSLGDEYRTIAMWINAFDMYGRKILQMHKISGLDYTLDWGPKGNNDPSGSLYIRSSANSTWLARGNSNYFNKNGWHHLAVRWNVGISRYELFADGDKKGTLGNANNQMEIINSGPLECSNYLGKLDDLRIYSRSLTDLEIKALCDKDGDGLTDVREAELGTNPNLADTDGDGDPDSNETIAGSSPTDSNDTILGKLLTNGLQVHLKFDETNGTTAFDSSGNNRHSTLIGLDGNSSNWKNGKIEGALCFDGINDWGQIGYNHPSRGTTTISLWLKTNSSFNSAGDYLGWDENMAILSGPKPTYGLFIDSGKFRFWVTQHTGMIRHDSSTNINTFNWYHLVSIIEHVGQSNDSTKYSIAINGSLINLGTKEYNNSTGTTLNLGKTPDSNIYFDGIMDDLRIYDRALSAAEVQALYNLGQ